MKLFGSFVYRNITWITDRELSRKLGKSASYVSKECSRGKTHEQLIDKFLDRHSYRGITWKNKTELSKSLGKGRYYVSALCRQGYTYEQIIDRVLDQPKKY